MINDIIIKIEYTFIKQYKLSGLDGLNHHQKKSQTMREFTTISQFSLKYFTTKS